jgi:hypothetical protein
MCELHRGEQLKSSQLYCSDYTLEAGQTFAWRLPIVAQEPGTYEGTIILQVTVRPQGSDEKTPVRVELPVVLTVFVP